MIIMMMPSQRPTVSTFSGARIKVFHVVLELGFRRRTMPDRQHARWGAEGGLLFVIELEFRCGTAQLIMPDLPHASTAKMEVCTAF